MGNLLIISNRLPFKLEKRGTNCELKETDGGLVTAIKSLTQGNTLKNIDKVRWIGSAGFSKQDWNVHSKLFSSGKIEIHLIFLNKKDERGFYHGFSNSVIWPLFHYFPSFVEYSEKNYASYEWVNKIYAEAISRIVQRDDVIWIHDYHFMLLPGYLRALGIENKLGFFLHIPFPSYELFRLLPQNWRENLLQNMLASDIVGFQTADYAAHFKESVIKCAVEIPSGSRVSDSLHGKIKDYPISIDFERFNAAYDSKPVEQARLAMQANYKQRKIIFSVDRLDYTKGVMNRLEAFEELLEEHPVYLGKISFILNVVPSRDEIGKYKERKKMIEENIGRINGRFGNIKWQPIIYQYRHLTFNQLLSFYTSCDVALVTPVRDGMNLVAKEFVASRKDEQGVLVLSDTAGAARVLKGAITVTPTDIRKMKECIILALEMPEQQQRQRMRSMREEVATNNVGRWAAKYLGDLLRNKKVEYHGAEILVV